MEAGNNYRFIQGITEFEDSVRFNAGLSCNVYSVSADCANLDTHGITILDSARSEMDPNLLDGTSVGQTCEIYMKTAGHNVDVKIFHHQTGGPRVLRFADVRDYLRLTWDGSDWVELINNGVDAQ